MTDLAALQVSTLCDADKSLVPLDPAIRLVAGPARVSGRARTVLAPGDHLPVLAAIVDAQPGDVLVIQAGAGHRAVAGELFATAAMRRGLAGIVIDGQVRDVAGLRAIGLPVWARGTYPASGTTAFVADQPGAVLCGGEAQLAAAADRAAAIERAEAAVLAGLADGRGLDALTNVREHLAALRAGRPSALEFRV